MTLRAMFQKFLKEKFAFREQMKLYGERTCMSIITSNGIMGDYFQSLLLIVV